MQKDIFHRKKTLGTGFTVTKIKIVGNDNKYNKLDRLLDILHHITRTSLPDVDFEVGSRVRVT